MKHRQHKGRTAVAMAVRFIEDHLNEYMSIHHIAQEVGISAYHFLRIFDYWTGETLGSYLRKRRLTVAAKQLLRTRQHILQIALNYGFESHEAFSRSFKKQFGCTPLQFRKNNKRHFFTERPPFDIRQDSQPLKFTLPEDPRILHCEEKKVVGIELPISRSNTNNQAPELWGRFMPHMHSIPGVSDPLVAVGISSLNSDFDIESTDEYSEFIYTAGVLVDEYFEYSNANFGNTVFCQRAFPEGKYAVFTVNGNHLQIPGAFDYIYRIWCEKTSEQIANRPTFEWYDQRFDMEEPKKSQVDIYIPLR